MQNKENYQENNLGRNGSNQRMKKKKKNNEKK